MELAEDFPCAQHSPEAAWNQDRVIALLNSKNPLESRRDQII
jgi:hypothetical protein